MSKNDKNDAIKKKSDGGDGTQRKSSVFDAPQKKELFDIPPTGGLFDSAAGDEPISPFDINVEPFQPDDKDIDQAVDQVFTSVRSDVVGTDGGALAGSKKSEAKPFDKATIGRRSETSILFSLGNLNSLANEPIPAEGSANTPSVGTNTEMSGLIDIRMLKEAFGEKEDNHVEELLSLGADAFSPVLTFQARGMSRSAKLAIIGVSAVLVAALIIAFAFALSGHDEDEGVNEQIAALQKQIEELRALDVGSPAQVAALEAKLAKAREQGAEARAASSQNQEALGSEEASDTKSYDRKKDGKSKNYKLKSKDAVSNPPTDDSESSTTSSNKGGSAEIDDLLSGTGSSSSSNKAKSGSSGKSGSSSGSQKKSLDREDVQKGLNAVAGKVKACGNGQGGMVTLKVVIGSSGNVLSAQPTGAHSGTHVGTCAAKVVKTAKFPKSQSSTTVSYPFRL
jgi:hypothetical protein